jgi:Pectate lyase superfamily protein
MAMTKAKSKQITHQISGGSTVSLYDKLGESVSVRDFSAVGDGVADDTVAIQAAINYCHTYGKTLYVPSGTYKITSQLTKSSSFNHPTIVGDGQNYSIIKGFGFTTGTALLLSTGGSGAVCGAVVAGLSFTSDNGNANGWEIDGQCGLTFRDCKFDYLKIGLDLHNKSSGNFGEFVVAESCDFTESCVEALVYRRTGGTDSFHGSGLRNCMINEAVGATLPKIRIGGSGSTSNDIIVYNAPLSFQVWKNTTTSVLVNNTTRYSTNFYGNITLELFGAANAAQWNFCNDTRNTYFIGGISSLQDKTKRGTLFLCDTFETKVDGTVNALLKPYRVGPITMASGANTISFIPGSTTETYFVRLRFADSASAARKVYLLAVNLDAFGVHTVTTIAQLEDYFGGSMPYPTFSMSGQSLVATAAFATTVSCTGTITKIGIGDAFSL